MRADHAIRWARKLNCTNSSVGSAPLGTSLGGEFAQPTEGQFISTGRSGSVLAGKMHVYQSIVDAAAPRRRKQPVQGCWIHVPWPDRPTLTSFTRSFQAPF